MKHVILLFIITSSLVFYTQNNTMAYYTDLSETINGEKYVSIYTYKKTYITGELLRDMSSGEISELLSNRNIKSKTSSVKLGGNAMLHGEDQFPDELYSLKALQNIDGNLILGNLEVKDGQVVIKLNSLGQVSINGKPIAKIKDNYEILNLKGEVLARMTRRMDLEDSLKNEIISINSDGSYREKGNEIKSSYRAWPLHRELRPTATALHYLFVLKNVLNLDLEKIKEEHNRLEKELKELLAPERDEREKPDSDLGKLLIGKIHQNYNGKVRKDEYKEGELVKYEFDRQLLIKQQEEFKDSEVDSLNKSLKQEPFSSFDVSLYLDLLLANDFNLEIYQVKNFNIKIKNNDEEAVLAKSTGYEELDRVILKKIGLEGHYNVSFNVAFFEGETIVKTIYHTKTSLLKPLKSISNKKRPGCQRDPNPPKTIKDLKPEK